jgi:hypothetical protein
VSDRPDVVRQQFPVNEFTEQQRYAVIQVYNAVKYGGYPFSDNATLAESMKIVAEMVSTFRSGESHGE